MPVTCKHCGGLGTIKTGEELRRLRKKKDGKTLAVVAKAVGVSISHLSDLENGHRDWNFKLVQRYLRALNERPS